MFYDAFGKRVNNFEFSKASTPLSLTLIIRDSIRHFTLSEVEVSLNF